MQEPVENQVIKTSPRGSRPRSLRAASLGVWGQSGAVMAFYHSGALADIVIILGILGVFYGIAQVGREWTGILRPTVLIDLSPRALPRYTFFSLSRGWSPTCSRSLFTLVYGYWAAKDRLAERRAVPAARHPAEHPGPRLHAGLVLALVALFPTSNIGLELAAVLMIFTGQAWNMTFSFYHSLARCRRTSRRPATVYRFNWWQRLRWIELPFATIGLVWNSMMSMAGGWFFLMINEAFVLGEQGLPAARYRLLHERGRRAGRRAGDGLRRSSP